MRLGLELLDNVRMTLPASVADANLGVKYGICAVVG